MAALGAGVVSLAAGAVVVGVATVVFSGAGALGVAVTLAAGGARAVGARSLVELRWVLLDCGIVVVEVEACREALGLAGSVSADFFDAVFDLAGVASRCAESVRVVAVEGSLPTSAEVAAVVLVRATLASGCAVFAVALDSVVVGVVEDDVTRSSTNAPPITVTTIAPIATPKWFIGSFQT